MLSQEQRKQVASRLCGALGSATDDEHTRRAWKELWGEHNVVAYFRHLRTAAEGPFPLTTAPE